MLTSKLTYVNAVPADSKLLSETAVLSKQVWGYPNELMEIWKPELEITKDYIRDNVVVKVFEEDHFIGFFALRVGTDQTADIDLLWLLPGRIGRGFGKEIFDYIIALLNLHGCKKARLTSDPNAKGFYKKMGGKVVGQVNSEVPGRMLDLYEFDIVVALTI